MHKIELWKKGRNKMYRSVNTLAATDVYIRRSGVLCVCQRRVYTSFTGSIVGAWARHLHTHKARLCCGPHATLTKSRTSTDHCSVHYPVYLMVTSVGAVVRGISNCYSYSLNAAGAWRSSKTSADSHRVKQTTALHDRICYLSAGTPVSDI